MAVMNEAFARRDFPLSRHIANVRKLGECIGGVDASSSIACPGVVAEEGGRVVSLISARSSVWERTSATVQGRGVVYEV
jgi:hypothetical protein